MGRKGGSVGTKTRGDNVNFELQLCDDDKAEEEEVLRIRAEQAGSITAADAGLEDDSEEVESDRELTMEIKGVDGELPHGFEESLNANATVQNVVKEDALSLPVRITQDIVEPVKINKSRADAKKKGEKRKRQKSGQDDIQGEAMLKLRAALEGKSRSKGAFGSTVVSKSDKAQKRQKLANKKLDDGMVDSDGKSEGSEDEFYKQVRQKREAKRAAKAQIYSWEPSSTLLLPETVDGKRLISNEIMGNKGLTQHRNKNKKNPRKNYRDKYTDKLKRRRGQVREIRKPSGPYGGEPSGINTISRCVRIKN